MTVAYTSHMSSDTHEPVHPPVLSEDEIEARLASRPELLEQFVHGDVRALAELFEVGTGAEVTGHEIRTPAV